MRLGRKKENLKIGKVTFTYSGTENNLDLFLKSIIHDHLAKTKVIDNSNAIPVKQDNKIMNRCM